MRITHLIFATFTFFFLLATSSSENLTFKESLAYNCGTTEPEAYYGCGGACDNNVYWENYNYRDQWGNWRTGSRYYKKKWGKKWNEYGYLKSVSRDRWGNTYCQWVWSYRPQNWDCFKWEGPYYR